VAIVFFLKGRARWVSLIARHGMEQIAFSNPCYVNGPVPLDPFSTCQKWVDWPVLLPLPRSYKI